MSQVRKPPAEETQATAKSTSMARRDPTNQPQGFGGMGLTDIPLPQIDLAPAAQAQLAAQARREAAIAQIPTGDLVSPPLPGTVSSPAYHQALSEASTLTALLTPEKPPLTPVVAAEQSVSTPPVAAVRVERPAPPRELAPQPQLQVRPDPVEAVKAMDPVVVVERAQDSERVLDAAQRVAFALRQMKDGKESAGDTLAGIETRDGKPAADAVRESLTALGIDTRPGADAPTANVLQNASQIADTSVLNSFRDFREQRTLASALPAEALASAQETLAARQQDKPSTKVSPAATVAEGAPVAKPDSAANEINNATQWLKSQAQAAGLDPESLDALVAAELLDNARGAGADAVIRIDDVQANGSTRSMVFTSAEFLDASKGHEQAGPDKSRDQSVEPVRVAQAEMEMGD